MAEIVTYDDQGFRSAHRRVKRLHDRGRRRHEEALRTGGSEDGEHEHGERVNAGAAASL